MLPPVIDEGEFFPFKFWFNNSIQDGMYYRNELFYRLHTVDLSNRARLYHYACKLAQRDRVVVSASDHTCSIWMSLRSSEFNRLTPGDRTFPAYLESASDDTGN